MKEPIVIAPQCLKFALHLFKTRRPENLHLVRSSKNPDLEELGQWRLTAQEWELAYLAASKSYLTGQDLDVCLHSLTNPGLVDLPSTPGTGMKRSWI